MRELDAKLREILKTETNLERTFRENPGTQSQFDRDVISGAYGLDIFDEKDEKMNKVLIGRMTRYVTWPPRKKTVLELSYVVSGCMRVRVGNEEILVKAGEFFMPNQYTMRSCCPLGENDIVLSIVMKTQFLEQICIRLKKDNPLTQFMMDILRRDIYWNRYLHFQDVDDLVVYNLIEALIYVAFPYLNDDNIGCGSPEDPKLVEMLAEALFVRLSQSMTAADKTASSNYDEVIRQTVLSYIASNYRNASLRQLAGIVNQSESALSRQIKTIFNATFTELLLNKRFERAVILLQQTELSVADIARTVGYENTSFFYRRFRQIYGISPKEFRKK